MSHSFGAGKLWLDALQIPLYERVEQDVVTENKKPREADDSCIVVLPLVAPGSPEDALLKAIVAAIGYLDDFLCLHDAGNGQFNKLSGQTAEMDKILQTAGGPVLLFGAQGGRVQSREREVIPLPSLAAMLAEPRLKRDAWFSIRHLRRETCE